MLWSTKRFIQNLLSKSHITNFPTGKSIHKLPIESKPHTHSLMQPYQILDQTHIIKTQYATTAN